MWVFLTADAVIATLVACGRSKVFPVPSKQKIRRFMMVSTEARRHGPRFLAKVICGPVDHGERTASRTCVVPPDLSCSLDLPRTGRDMADVKGVGET